jgi:hypothetical protein
MAEMVMAVSPVRVGEIQAHPGVDIGGIIGSGTVGIIPVGVVNASCHE